MVLMNYLLPRDIIATVEWRKITGLAVPPSLGAAGAARVAEHITQHLRYITNSGGHMRLQP